jgi:hypothetical protein
MSIEAEAPSNVKINYELVLKQLMNLEEHILEIPPASDRLGIYNQLIATSQKLDVLLNMNKMILQNPIFLDSFSLNEMETIYSNLNNATKNILSMVINFQIKLGQFAPDELGKSIDLAVFGKTYIS